MPIASKPTRSPTRRAPAKSVPKAAFQAPLIEDDARPQDHKGVPIVSEQTTSNLPNGATFRISRLFLANGTNAYGCRDCKFTGDTRADVQQHRNAEHGAKYGKKTPRVIFPPDKNVPDLVLPARQDGVAAPTNPMQMTLGEILALMPSIAATSDLVDRMEVERDAAVSDLAERERHDRENAHKINVYESHVEELLDLRMKIRNVGSYEQAKAELLELRAWKKAMIKKLSALGFKLSEEEE